MKSGITNLFFLLPAGIASLLSASDSNAPVPEESETSPVFWNAEKEQALIARREDSTTWDMHMFENDQAFSLINDLFPFSSGVFPVPRYELVGKDSFRGVGNFGYPGGEGLEEHIGEQRILYNCFYVGESPVNKEYLNGKPDEVFFQIIVLTDFVDTVNYSHLSSEIVSRNHPHYVGQGYYKTQHGIIDYSAFLTADRNAYALINMRLFDLRQGKTILIAPHTDGSYRSMQLASPLQSHEEIEKYTRELLQEPRIRSFFTAPGTLQSGQLTHSKH